MKIYYKDELVYSSKKKDLHESKLEKNISRNYEHFADNLKFSLGLRNGEASLSIYQENFHFPLYSLNYNPEQESFGVVDVKYSPSSGSTKSCYISPNSIIRGKIPIQENDLENFIEIIEKNNFNPKFKKGMTEARLLPLLSYIQGLKQNLSYSSNPI